MLLLVENPPSSMDMVLSVLKFIFSWIVLMAIGVIMTGKLITQRLKLTAGREMIFRIPLVFFSIEASGAEVVLGFTFYLICVLLLGTVFGSHLDPWVKDHFGVDAGQLNALGFMSSLLSVAIAFAVFMLSKAQASRPGDELLAKHDAKVNSLTEKQIGKDPASLPEVKE